MRGYKFVIFIAILFSCENKRFSVKKDFSIKVNKEVLAEIDNDLFGHFLEKVSFSGPDGEIGGDILIDTLSGNIYPQAMNYLKAMNIPLIRYPGGIDVDYYPWYDLIDNAPRRKSSKRPLYSTRNNGTMVVSNNWLGLDEFLNLCVTIHAKPLLVVNLGDTYHKKISIKEAAQHAAAMVAYCNIPQGKKLSGLKDDWPAIRARNGHPEPWNVKYWEVGNEPWQWKGLEMDTKNDAAVSHYLNCLEAIVEAMRAVDSSIIIITDGGIGLVADQLKSRFGNKINMVAYHPYQPWGIRTVLKGTDTVNIDTLSDRTIWNAWVSIPSIDTINGMARFTVDMYYKNVMKSGYPVAITEWNWNGGWWDKKRGEKIPYNSKYCRGIGACGYLHAMIRAAAKVKIGCQSMLAGRSWGIASIYFKNDSIFHHPTGKVTGFYSRFHGKNLLMSSDRNNTFYEQPYTMNALFPSSKVAVIDYVVTADPDRIYVHLINRSYDKDMPVVIDVSEKGRAKKIIHHMYITTDDDLGKFQDTTMSESTDRFRVILPRQSVSIIECQLE